MNRKWPWNTSAQQRQKKKKGLLRVVLHYMLVSVVICGLRPSTSCWFSLWECGLQRFCCWWDLRFSSTPSCKETFLYVAGFMHADIEAGKSLLSKMFLSAADLSRLALRCPKHGKTKGCTIYFSLISLFTPFSKPSLYFVCISARISNNLN